MTSKTLRVGFLVAIVILLLTAGCITINLPGGTTEPTPSTPPTTTPTTPTVQPTLPVQPTVTIKPTLPVLQPSLSGTKWILEEMGAPADLKPALTVRDVTLNFTDATKLGGSAGCNSYSGEYESTMGGELKVSDITRTLMLCTQPRLMDQEKDFLDALDEAKSCKVVSGKLNITADDGMLLVLSAA